jgi:putative PIN family toxin of toxin-antitoxin system
MRAVLDTNVLVSAFARPRGRVALLWRAAQARRYRLLLSPAIVREVARVLREDFFWEESRIIRRLKQLSKKGEIVIPRMTIEVIHDDPADNHILECAVASHADVIVSGDHHLLRLKSYEGIPIVRPIDFRRTLGLKE